MGRRCGVDLRVVGFVLAAFVLVPGVGAFDINPWFTDNMVLQRDKPLTIWGTGAAGEQVTVRFAGQSKTATVDATGSWAVTLEPMPASADPRTLSLQSQPATGDVTLSNILVGDVWFFGRQTSVDISLGRSAAGRAAAAQLTPEPTFRAISITTKPAIEPLKRLDAEATSGWVQVDAETALAVSAAAVHLGRALVRDLGVPVGIVDVNMGPYFGLGWLSDQAIADAATMHPNDKEIGWLPGWLREQAEERISGKAQAALDAYYEKQVAGARGKAVEKPSLGLHPLQNPMYPAAGFNAVIHPLKGISLRGMLVQLGNDYPFIIYRQLEKEGKAAIKAELDAAWGHTYPILKNGYRVTPVTLPYVPRDWRRALGEETLPIGLVLPPGSDLDVYAAHNREIREMHRRTSEQNEAIGLIMPGADAIPFSGQPADDRLLAERCRRWVLGAVVGKRGVAASGPVFDRVDAYLTRATVHFKEGTAAGLTATGNGLELFETAGPDGVFTRARATIEGATVLLKSDGPIQFVRYNWTAKPTDGLVNGDHLPALPFSSDPDWTFAWIPPPAEPDLPVEYTLTADKWSKSDIAIINGQIASMDTGDSEPIPRRPGPIGIYSSPFGPNIYVISIDPGTPADGTLQPGDVIYAVNGRSFSDEAGVAEDQQYRDLSAAIRYSESEAGQGIMVLGVRRGTRLIEVELELGVLGSYSSTTPYYCEKSANIVKNAEAWSARRYRPETGMPSEPCGMLNTDLLFLLASGTPEHQGLVRRAVYSMMASMEPKPVTPGTVSKPWSTGHASLALGEYFHATGDRNVLPYLKYQADLSAESQLKPKDETPPTKEAAQSDEQVGGWRHNYPGGPERWKSGYGLLPHAGMGCVMGMLLAKEAGEVIDDVALERGLVHFNKNRAEYGFVLYSYWDTHRDGPPPMDPEAEAGGTLWSMNGKLGMAAALYSMVDGRKDTVDICARHCVYGFNRTRSGHGGMFFNNFWTPVGAWAAGEKGFKHFMKGQTWWRELFRRSDGSFNQVGRGGIGVSYALPYVAPKQRLRILGAPRSAFGTNCPLYLKPAVEAHRNRDYALCAKLVLERLDSVLPAADLPVVHHLLESVRTLRASIDHDLGYVEGLIEDGKHYYASLELRQLKGVVAADDPRLGAVVAALESPEGVAAVAAHRRACEAEQNAREAARKAAARPPAREDWVTLVAQKGGERPAGVWRKAVLEHISQAPEGWDEPGFDDGGWYDVTLPKSWCPYHTALFRTTFTIEDKEAIDGLRMEGRFFQQANVVIYLNGEVVAKVDNLGRGTGDTDVRFTDYAMTLLKEGENTMAVSSRHKRRWGPFRGTYKTAATVGFEIQARKKAGQ